MTQRKRKGPIAADELIAKREEMLHNDPEYRAQVEAIDVARRTRARQLWEAERPIVDDLNAVGVKVGSVWDLVNTSEPYPAALPVLIGHVERGGYPDRVMESLGRALAVKPAVAYWERLRALYLAAKTPGEEDGMAVALSACATKAQYDDLVALLSVKHRGESRIYFLRPIRRLGGDKGRALLESLREDPIFGKEASALLGRP